MTRSLRITPEGRLDAPDLMADRGIRRAFDLLNGAGEETRLVGGAVRNALLGMRPGDIDMATTMPPAAIAARAEGAGIRWLPTGMDHGTVTLLCSGTPIEVTTLREDIETDGRHAVVRFGRDFAMDAKRRDLTMNALSIGPDGRVHDTVGGVEDLMAGRVRFVGDASTRMREDHLRILRFFRFHATYGLGPLDGEGLAAAAENADGLDRLSRERVSAELMKLLATDRAHDVLCRMEDHGLASRALRHPVDIPRHGRMAKRDGVTDPVLRLAALAVREAADVVSLRDGMRLSNRERDRMDAAWRVSASLDDTPDATAVRRLLFTRGPEATQDGILLAMSEREDVGAWRQAYLHAVEAPVPPMPFKGQDAVALGLSGPAVGEALARFRSVYVDADFPVDATERRDMLEAAARPSATPCP